MPIVYSIDHDRRLVLARGHGVFTDEDVFGYQCEVWSRSDVAGYNELIDMTGVERVVLQSVARVRELAGLSAHMDARTPASKLAIVAPDDLAYGLGRMYEVYRGLEPESTKQVSVFRSMADALAFLGLADEQRERSEPPNKTAPEA
jgi:hypothetical protein